MGISLCLPKAAAVLPILGMGTLAEVIMTFVELNNLRKIYRSKTGLVRALDGLDLAVPEGTITALLGPNGAGKTTAVKVLATLVRPDAGSAWVNGLNVVDHPARVRETIGVSGQYAAVDENLTGLENLEMVGRLYHLGVKQARNRARELVDTFELSEAGSRPVKGFSGGMRRRIDLAAALVNKPRVLFLDEPTTGLDPRSRIALWGIIKNLVSSGTTVLLTTQYLEEADQLADDIAVIDSGRAIARGTSDQLKSQVGGHRVEVVLVNERDSGTATSIIARHGAGEPRISQDGRSIGVAVTDGPAALQRILTDMDTEHVDLHDAGIRRPTLDDVFLKLTGHVAEESDGSQEAAATKAGRQ